MYVGVCERVTEKRICVCDPSTLRLHYHTAHCSGPRFVLQSHAPFVLARPGQPSVPPSLHGDSTPPVRCGDGPMLLFVLFRTVLYRTWSDCTVLVPPTRRQRPDERRHNIAYSPISAATCTLGTLPESSKSLPSIHCCFISRAKVPLVLFKSRCRAIAFTPPGLSAQSGSSLRYATEELEDRSLLCSLVLDLGT